MNKIQKNILWKVYFFMLISFVLGVYFGLTLPFWTAIFSGGGLITFELIFGILMSKKEKRK